MPFTEHDHLVESLPADGADEPFHVGILPGCARAVRTSQRPRVLGRIHSWNGSSARFGASASTISSFSASHTCIAS